MLKPLLTIAIAFMGLSATAQQVPNGQFENWSFVQGHDVPNLWRSFSASQNLVTKVQGAGSPFAVKLMIVAATDFAIITSAPFPASGRPTQLSFDYKHIAPTATVDSAYYVLRLWKAGVPGYVVNKKVAITNETNMFLQETLAITYPDTSVTVDSADISFLIGTSNIVIPGSQLHIDKVMMSGGLGTNVATQNQLGIALHPNPTTGDVYALVGMAGKISFVVSDLAGRTVLTQSAPVAQAASALLPTAGLANGCYVVRATAGAKTGTAKLVISR